jgi:hypothetical protein
MIEIYVCNFMREIRDGRVNVISEEERVERCGGKERRERSIGRLTRFKRFISERENLV